MKNIKFKTVLVALTVSAALALSVAGCSSSGDKAKETEETKEKVEETTTEETTEETTVETTTEATEETDDDLNGGNEEFQMPEPASVDDFNDEGVKAIAQMAVDDGLEIMKIDADMADDMENYVEGFLASGGSMSVSASVDEDGNSSSDVSEDSSMKIYICYLFEDEASAKKMFDENVDSMFSYYDESAYTVKDTETGSILNYEQDGVTAEMAADGCIYYLIEKIG